MTVTSAQVRQFAPLSPSATINGLYRDRKMKISIVLTWSPQPLDNKTLTKLENAVAKSSFVGQGKKLKVTNDVRISLPPITRHPILG